MEQVKILEECIKEGKMDLVTLQNLHLMPKCSKVLKMIWKRVSQTASPNFRCFISSEPPALPTIVIIPEPLLIEENLELLVGPLNITSIKVIYKLFRCDIYMEKLCLEGILQITGIG